VRAPGTIADLLDDAASRGHTASERMILDWVGEGLLDHPQRQPLGRGKGSDRALFSSSQRELFNVLIDQRDRTVDGKPAVRRLATLTNVPVWIWLTASDEHVPLRQVRVALRTYVRTYHRASERRATVSSRELLTRLAHPESTAKDRHAFTRVVSLAAGSGEFDRVAFLDAARRVSDPHNRGVLVSPDAALLNELATEIEARYIGGAVLEEFTDTDYERARWIRRQTWNDYTGTLRRPTETGDDIYEQLGPPTLEQLVNDACNDLLTLLGMGVLYARDHPYYEPTSS
jgi:hypothetical protein